MVELSAPIDVQIELTESCNQHCGHCYNFWRPNDTTARNDQHLSIDSLKHIIQELVINRVISITITGGEPFVRRDEFFALLQMAQEADIRASINTNFSIVRKSDIINLATNYQVPILVSLLSADANEHARLAGVAEHKHRQVIKNIALAIQHNLSVSINMVLMHDNLHGMKALADLAKQLGVRTFCATKALSNTHTGNAFLLTKEEVLWSLRELIGIERALNLPVDILGCYPKCLLADTEAYQRFFHRVCVAGKTTLTIGADGGVRPCSHAIVSYGNIFSEALSDIWQKMKKWRNNEILPDQCRECKILTWCTGGCRMNTLTQSISDKDIYADRTLLDGMQEHQLSPHVYSSNSSVPSEVFIHPKVGFREESFGALFFRYDRPAIIFVNQSTKKFLQSIEKGQNFSLDIFLQKSGAVSENDHLKVKHLYSKLIHKGILIASKT